MYHVISTYLGIVIMMIGIVLFAKIVLNSKIKIPKLQLIIIILLVSLVYTYTYLNFEGTIKTVIIFIINILIYKTIFKITYSKSVFLTILYIITLIIPDMLSLIIYTKVFGIDKVYFYSEMAGGIIGNFTVCVLFVITTCILKEPLRKLVNCKIENNVKIILFSILTLICVVIFFFSLINEYESSDNILSYILTMILSTSILLSLIKQTIENEKLIKKYDKLLEFMTTYEEEIEKQRTLRHETKNELINIKGQIIDNRKKDSIIDYINSILNDKTKIKFEEYAKFHYLPPNGIKGLCYFKVSEAQSRGITVGINISSQVTKSSIYKLNMEEQREFGKMLGVFLDNAIEASAICKEKKIGIEAYSRNQEFQMIISNTYKDEIDIDKIGKEKFTTKGKNRGHGLLLVKSIVENNPIFEIKKEMNNKLYIQYIKIKKSI